MLGFLNTRPWQHHHPLLIELNGSFTFHHPRNMWGTMKQLQRLEYGAPQRREGGGVTISLRPATLEEATVGAVAVEVVTLVQPETVPAGWETFWAIL